MSIKQINELSLADFTAQAAEPVEEVAYAPEDSYANQAAMVMAPAGETTSSGAMAIGDPVPSVQTKNITVYAGNITPVSYSDSDNIACFDVVFSVGVSCEDGSKTYQVVKRIGIDKQKIAAEAESSLPVSIVEAQAPAKVEKAVPATQKITVAQRARRLAGLE